MASFDLGSALSGYAQGNQGALIGFLNREHLPLTQQSTEFLQDEQDMSIASGRTGLFNGWSLPAGKDSRNDFFALMTTAESFAAASGWQYFPMPWQLQWGVEHGMAQQPSQAQWAWLANLNPRTQAQPWLQAGMSQQQFKDYGNRLGDVYQQYTGDSNAPASILAQAAQGNWSAQRFQQFLQNDPTTVAKFGWIKHGMTYNDFQQYKLTNQQPAAQRFGANAGDSQYLQMLNQPLTQSNMQGAQVQQSQQTQTAGGATSFGRQGEAR